MRNAAIILATAVFLAFPVVLNAVNVGQFEKLTPDERIWYVAGCVESLYHTVEALGDRLKVPESKSFIDLTEDVQFYILRKKADTKDQQSVMVIPMNEIIWQAMIKKYGLDKKGAQK